MSFDVIINPQKPKTFYFDLESNLFFSKKMATKRIVWGDDENRILNVGAHVNAQWCSDGWFYKGTIIGVNVGGDEGPTYVISFDDGDFSVCTKREDIYELTPTLATKVEVEKLTPEDIRGDVCATQQILSKITRLWGEESRAKTLPGKLLVAEKFKQLFESVGGDICDALIAQHANDTGMIPRPSMRGHRTRPTPRDDIPDDAEEWEEFVVRDNWVENEIKSVWECGLCGHENDNFGECWICESPLDEESNSETSINSTLYYWRSDRKSQIKWSDDFQKFSIIPKSSMSACP